MSDVTTHEPTKFTAGDTVSWLVSHASYLSTDGWAVLYAFVRATAQKLVAGVGQPDGTHLITITAAESTLWTPGEYAWQKYAMKAAVRDPLGDGFLNVAPNFLTATTGLDFRSTAEQMVALLEVTMKGRATTDELNHTIDTAQGSRSVGLLTPAQLSSEFLRWSAILEDERAKARMDKGLGGSKILFRIGGL